MVSRGEIWWYEHPETSRRPFLILTRDEAIPFLNMVLAAATTTRVRGIPTEVPLGKDDGMPVDCVLSLDNVYRIRPALCVERITVLGPERMQEVCDALRHAIAC